MRPVEPLAPGALPFYHSLWSSLVSLSLSLAALEERAGAVLLAQAPVGGVAPPGASDWLCAYA